MKVLINFLHSLAASHYALVDLLTQNGVIDEAQYHRHIRHVKKNMEAVMKLIGEDDELKERLATLENAQNASREA